jgi:hypothetical protein
MGLVRKILGGVLAVFMTGFEIKDWNLFMVLLDKFWMNLGDFLVVHKWFG